MFLPYHTKVVDERAARVKSLVALLDRKWFLEKEREFKALCNEGDDFYVLDHTPNGYEEYLQSQPKEEPDRNNFEQAVNFSMFCFEDGYSTTGISGKAVSWQIISVIKEIAVTEGKLTSEYEYKALNDEALTWIKEEVTLLKRYYTAEEYIGIVGSFESKSLWMIERACAITLKEIREKRISVAPYTHPFKTDDLNGIFYPIAIKLFIDIERQLVSNNVFKSGRWDNDKNALASMILILKARGYLRKVAGKSESTSRLVYRRFFEDRYNIIIEKQMQPGEIQRFNLPKSYERTFAFIPDISQIK